MNEIYSKVVIARFKRGSARPAGCPVAFRIEAGALTTQEEPLEVIKLDDDVVYNLKQIDTNGF